MALVPRNSKFVPQYVSNSLTGLVLSNSPGDVNNDIAVDDGACADSTNTFNMILSTAITKRLDATWVAGTNNGGLDTGAKAANTTYHVYVIFNATTQVTDVLFSTSASAPTMPSGYTYFRRIGSIITNASANIVNFTQVGDYFFPTSTLVGYSVDNVGAVTNTAITISNVPTGIRVKLLGQGHCSAVNNQTTGYAWFSAAGQSSPSADSVTMGGGNVESSIMMASGAHTAGEASANWHQNQTTFCLLTNTSAQIVLTSNPGSLGGNVNVRVRVQGWIDERGKVS